MPESSPTTPAGRARAVLRTRRGADFALPLFMPVYQPRALTFTLGGWQGEPEIEACIVNAFFLYKERALRRRFEGGLTLRDHIGFDGLVTTDSGAFQGFTRKLLLSNRKIVAFQDMIGTDVAAPLDLVTPPGDGRVVAERKLEATQKRIREGLALTEHCILAGVQQGGRFFDLRRRSVEELAEMGVEYLAIGSLVPFFNKNHDLGFVAKVLRDARDTIGPDVPMHIYGAGDPVELPFMVHFGADIFDSSSYAHYAKGGWYMTAFGAVNEPDPLLAGEYRCACPICGQLEDISAIFNNHENLVTHNLWTICRTLADIRSAIAEGRLDALLGDVLERHMAWFPESGLAASLDALDG